MKEPRKKSKVKSTENLNLKSKIQNLKFRDSGQKKALSLKFADPGKSRYHALREATKKWTMPIQNWGIVLNQLMLIFEERLRL